MNAHLSTSRKPAGRFPKGAPASRALRTVVQRALAIALTIIAHAASAQVAGPPAGPALPSAGQLTPRSIAPQQNQSAVVPVIEAAPPQAPVGADKLTFTPSVLNVEGLFGSTQDALARATALVGGQRITVARFYEIAAEIERSYAASGLPLVRVVVPAQRLVDGAPARLVVVNGFIEDIDVANVVPSLRRPIRKLLLPMVGRRGLRFDELERRLSLVEDISGASTRSTLAPGAQTGGVKLVIEAERTLVSGSIAYNNRQGRAFNSRQTSYQIAINSPLGHGEQFYAYASADPFDGLRMFRSAAARRSFGGGVLLPLDALGTRLNVEATRSITQPLGGAFRTRDVYSRVAARLSFPAIRTRTTTLLLTTTYEYFAERNSATEFGVDLSLDRYHLVRLVGDYSRTFEGGIFTASSTLTQAMGSQDEIAPPSRATATGNFAKVDGTASVSRALPAGFVATLSASGQLILGGGLPSSELFSLDGANALSAFNAGALATEQGFSVRGEAKRPIILGRSVSVAPFAYAAFGRGFFSPRTAFDFSRAYAYGAGVQADIHPPGTSIAAFGTLEFGHRHSDGLLADNGNRFLISAGLRF